jgi:hypothetical protein
MRSRSSQSEIWDRFERIANQAEVYVERAGAEWVVRAVPRRREARPVSFQRPRLVDAVDLIVNHFDAFAHLLDPE